MSTFQDKGRTGYQRFGVPVSGAMDRFALQVANILVGNPRYEACIEVALIGPKIEMLHSMTIAITGANLEPKVNGEAKPMWTSFTVYKGDRLSFGRHQEGVFAYIAIAGGIDCPSFLGSKSTDVKSGFGVPVEKGVRINGFPRINKTNVGLKISEIPVYKKKVEIAVIEGPHTEMFTAEEREQFFNVTHTLEANSNRMGYRLKTNIEHWGNTANIWSDAIPYGGIQIPPNGQPIILMADRQTTGGYPRIGTVISSDLSKLAQLVPRGQIQFYRTTIEEAQNQAIKMEKSIRNLALFRKNIN